MKSSPECRDCLLSKVESQAAKLISDKATLSRLVSHCAEIFDTGTAAGEGATITAGAIHRYCASQVGGVDLFAEVKVRDNCKAQAVVEDVKPLINGLHDTLVAAVLGNAMDYGVTGHKVADDFTAYFEQVFSQGLAIDDSEKFLPLAKNVIYFTDNCGEVIFDMLFIEELKKMGAHVTVVVKDGAMLNDVTLKEAADVGLAGVADAIYCGGGGSLLGTHPPYFPPEVQEAFDEATLIISKGLANYESLTEYELGKPIAYLMMIKCDTVGRHIAESSGRDVKKGDLVAYFVECV